MNLQECYERLGGSYADVLARMCGEARVERFVRRFLQDTSFVAILPALEAGDHDGAYRAVHSLKGVAMNLSFLPLQSACEEMCAAMRAGDYAVAQDRYAQVAECYRRTVQAIEEFAKE